MSRMLELPDRVHTALEEAASASGLSPAAWIAAHLPSDGMPDQPNGGVEPPRTLADLFAGRVGQIANGGRERLSENAGERFTDSLEAKRREGRL